MELGRLLVFAAAVSPALYALGRGRGFVWQLLALLCTGLAFAALFTSFAFAIVAWIIAWVFAGIAAAQPKPDEGIDDKAIARSIRKGKG